MIIQTEALDNIRRAYERTINSWSNSVEKMARISYANVPSFGSGAGKIPEPPNAEPTFKE